MIDWFFSYGSYHVPIKIIPMVLPCRLLGGGVVGGWGEGLGFATVGGSGCENVSHHVPIQIITVLLPFRVFWGWRGLGFTTVDGSGCIRVLECFFSYGSYRAPIKIIPMVLPFRLLGGGGVGGGVRVHDCWWLRV